MFYFFTFFTQHCVFLPLMTGAAAYCWVVLTDEQLPFPSPSPRERPTYASVEEVLAQRRVTESFFNIRF